METPWGKADYTQVHSEGITFYGTPSHGGFKLLAKRNTEVPQYLKDATWNNQGNYGWYEEDVDWSIVAMVFPFAFAIRNGEPDNESVPLAHSIWKSTHPVTYAQFEAEQVVIRG